MKSILLTSSVALSVLQASSAPLFAPQDFAPSGSFSKHQVLLMRAAAFVATGVTYFGIKCIQKQIELEGYAPSRVASFERLLRKEVEIGPVTISSGYGMYKYNRRHNFDDGTSSYSYCLNPGLRCVIEISTGKETLVIDLENTISAVFSRGFFSESSVFNAQGIPTKKRIAREVSDVEAKDPDFLPDVIQNAINDIKQSQYFFNKTQEIEDRLLFGNIDDRLPFWNPSIGSRAPTGSRDCIRSIFLTQEDYSEYKKLLFSSTARFPRRPGSSVTSDEVRFAFNFCFRIQEDKKEHTLNFLFGAERGLMLFFLIKKLTEKLNNEENKAREYLCVKWSLPAGSTFANLTKAYRQKARETHPDITRNTEAEAFKEIGNAWDNYVEAHASVQQIKDFFNIVSAQDDRCTEEPEEDMRRTTATQSPLGGLGTSRVPDQLGRTADID